MTCSSSDAANRLGNLLSSAYLKSSAVLIMVGNDKQPVLFVLHGYNMLSDADYAQVRALLDAYEREQKANENDPNAKKLSPIVFIPPLNEPKPNGLSLDYYSKEMDSYLVKGGEYEGRASTTIVDFHGAPNSVGGDKDSAHNLQSGETAHIGTRDMLKMVAKRTREAALFSCFSQGGIPDAYACEPSIPVLFTSPYNRSSSPADEKKHCIPAIIRMAREGKPLTLETVAFAYAERVGDAVKSDGVYNTLSDVVPGIKKQNGDRFAYRDYEQQLGQRGLGRNGTEITVKRHRLPDLDCQF